VISGILRRTVAVVSLLNRKATALNNSTRRLLWGIASIPVVLLSLLLIWIGAAVALYPNEYVRRVLVMRESDVWNYLEDFPTRELTASPDPYQYDTALEPDRVQDAFASAFETDDLQSFLRDTGSQAFIVIQNDQVIYEAYFNGWERDSTVTSFSIAKSFTSALIGRAIQDGYIESLDDPITAHLHELAERDARFADITIEHLLMMSSGLDYEEMRWFLFNGDDPLTTYHPDQRAISLENTEIVGPPGETFSYNKYHPQLLGMVLERSTGRSVTQLTQDWIWDPLGMEFEGAWTLDSEESGFEKMEAGLNARAIDFAKLGSVFLHEGEWNGNAVLSRDWVALSTGVDPAGLSPTFDDRLHYALMWWGITAADGRYDYFAAGDHGQYIYVSPDNDLIIVRTGETYDIPSEDWVDGFSRAAGEL
jgi:CubicO group peptidase (beta-lactamase class C family)